MDKQVLFDALSVRLGDRPARRDVLRLVAQFVLALVVFQINPLRAAAQSGSESALVKGCRLPGQKCNNGKQDCCAKKCTGAGRCGCISKGREPLVDTPLGPVPVKALCCTNNLNRRTGECR
jgi:hypothetical protein